MEIEEYARCLKQLVHPNFTSLSKTKEELLLESADLLLELKANLTYMLAHSGYKFEDFEQFKHDFPQ